MASSESGAITAEPDSEQQCCKAAEKLLRQGHPLLAYDAIRRAGECVGSSIRLRQLMALSLARSGAPEEARRVAFSLYDAGARDEETLGIIARSEKDLARAAATAEETREHLAESFRAYEMAYRQSGGYWSGINAATVAMLLGKCEFAVHAAKAVREQCLSKLADLAPEEQYWIYPTLGEAALILGEISEAEDCYRRTVEGAVGDWGSLRSVRQNARLLTRHTPVLFARLEAIFNFPKVIIFSGHMFDQAGRENARFQPKYEEPVRREIRARLEQLNGMIGFGSAACGSDILFHEVLQEKSGESHVILPFRRAAFVSSSVATAAGDYEGRFQRVVDAATDLLEATNGTRAADGSYEYTNLLLQGSADLRCREIETELVGLAVWDGKKGDGPGGTESCIQHWRQNNVRVEVIRLDEIMESAYEVGERSTEAVTECAMAENETAGFPIEIRSLLFADVVGFSKFSDEQIPFFVKNFLGMVSDLTNHLPWKPLMKNTWGDGIYLVFNDVACAGNFALALKDAVQSTDWSSKELPQLQVRIGLHAGPVYSCVDPLTQNHSYIGAHVSSAARIEPITPPGQVYCSQAFAALAAAQGVKDFACDYVGRTSLAKNFGTYPTYVARRCGVSCGRMLL